MAALAPSTISRAKVLELRQRAEIAVTSIYDIVIQPQEKGDQSRFREKVACAVLVAVDNPPLEGDLAVVRLARLFYRLSSDFLHGRSNMLTVPPALLAEWEVLVCRLERLARTANGSSTT